MLDNERRSPDTKTNAIDKDPQGWKLDAVPERDVAYLDQMDERGAWDSVAAGRALQRLLPEEGSRVVVLGRGMSSRSPHIGLFEAIASEVQENRGKIPAASERHPGLAVTFSDTPTPEQIQEFLDRNSTQAGYMTPWTADGLVPYVALEGDHPGVVEYGMMDTKRQTRTRAAREYFPS